MTVHYTKPRENSVRNLQTLYSIVIGLGLLQSIRTFVGDPVGQIDIGVLPFFLSYLFILIPFYHGALRHLDATYIEGSAKGIKAGALMADFLLLFIEAILFLALSMLLTASVLFSWVIVSLFFLDAVWGFLVHLAFSDRADNLKKKWSPESEWARLNIITSAVLAIYVIFHPLLEHPSIPYFGIGLAFICFVRTVIDYMMTWDFYFPPIENDKT